MRNLLATFELNSSIDRSGFRRRRGQTPSILSGETLFCSYRFGKLLKKGQPRKGLVILKSG